ncbi:MAG: TIGR03618 family F420-dependent PPOX class oxidoreductase [Acidobacteria bacterium]|nr:TIGR03618 family F420-dependent PPOX class oxidoreductase [Acidobacteriota bacterium]MBI3422855.1 TIGR03618 family F420-dependent PPOX class oxidoreductase [Acidobacteriota bacterium]
MGKKLSGKWAVYVGLEKLGRLATIAADGMPHNTPVYYALLDGEIFIGTQRGRKKFRNLQQNPNVCLTIDSTEQPYRGIMIQGQAEIITDELQHTRFREAIIHRYYGSSDNPAWQYVQSLGASVVFKINAGKIYTWDFSPN